MQREHTPGPWHFDYEPRSELAGYRGRNRVLGPDGNWICSTVNDWPTMPFEANGNLIAAAPELLDSLVTLVDWVDPNETLTADWPALLYARAAIAKARGE